MKYLEGTLLEHIQQQHTKLLATVREGLRKRMHSDTYKKGQSTRKSLGPHRTLRDFIFSLWVSGFGNV